MTEIEEIMEEGIEKIENENKTSENDEDEWLDVIGSGGLKKKIIEEGEENSKPTKGHWVKINIEGRLPDGTKVDCHDNLEFTLGDTEVINGLDLIVSLMNKGETADVFMESRFAYGEIGLEPDIPANADLTYRICVLESKIEEAPEEKSVEERLSIGIRKRERGNWWFRRGENSNAISNYKTASDYLDDTTDTYGEELPLDVRHLFDERLKTLNNLATAQKNAGVLDGALRTLQTVLSCQPDNIKALYRKGQILGLKGNPKEGLAFLNRAYQLEPSGVIGQEIKKQKEAHKEIAKEEKKFYRRMFGFSETKEEAEDNWGQKYSTVKSTYFKTWILVFVVLFACMMLFSHRDELWNNFMLTQ